MGITTSVSPKSFYSKTQNLILFFPSHIRYRSRSKRYRPPGSPRFHCRHSRRGSQSQESQITDNASLPQVSNTYSFWSDWNCCTHQSRAEIAIAPDDFATDRFKIDTPNSIRSSIGRCQVLLEPASNGRRMLHYLCSMLRSQIRRTRRLQSEEFDPMRWCRDCYQRSSYEGKVLLF